MASADSAPDSSPSTPDTDDSEVVPEELRCVNFTTCGNATPGPENGACDECLDEARANGRGIPPGIAE